MNLELFEPQVTEIIAGQVTLYPGLFSPAEADVLLTQLQQEIDWRSERLYLYGRELQAPRLTAWYGDPGKSYSYSGVTHQPKPWTAALQQIRQRVEEKAQTHFNSVLLNLYRDGSDSVSWHSDDEPELGPQPVIASVSFGEPRTFQLRHKRDKSRKHALVLPHGSLLLMQGNCQAEWLHQLPKSQRPMQPRINLTFRVIRQT